MAVEYPEIVLAEPSLVSYWRLGEASGTDAVDVKGGIDGVYTSSPVLGEPGFVYGDADTAVDFSAGTVVIPDDASHHFNDVFSVEFIIQFSSLSGFQSVIDKRNAPIFSEGFTVYKDAGTHQLVIQQNNPIAKSSAMDLDPHHILITKDGGTTVVYVDGEDVTAAGLGDETIVDVAGPLGIGSTLAVIDEVALYNTALTADDAALHSLAAFRSNPEITPEVAEDVGVYHATIKGLVDPRGLHTVAWFTVTPGNGDPAFDTEEFDVGDSIGDVEVSVDLTGLKPETYYTFDLHAVTDDGFAGLGGYTQSFQTLVRGSRPVIPTEEVMLSTLPHWYANDNTIRGIVHAYAIEVDLALERANNIAAQAVPATADTLLAAWEITFGLVVNDVTKTLTKRREDVAAAFLNMIGDPSARHMQTTLAAIFGPGYSYLEHDPDDTDNTPIPYMVAIFATLDAPTYFSVYPLLRKILPANTGFDLVNTDGFRLDGSELDGDDLLL